VAIFDLGRKNPGRNDLEGGKVVDRAGYSAMMQCRARKRSLSRESRKLVEEVALSFVYSNDGAQQGRMAELKKTKRTNTRF